MNAQKIFKAGGRHYFLRVFSMEPDPRRTGYCRLHLRFFRLRWYDRALGFVGALYVVAKAAR